MAGRSVAAGGSRQRAGGGRAGRLRAGRAGGRVVPYGPIWSHMDLYGCHWIDYSGMLTNSLLFGQDAGPKPSTACQFIGMFQQALNTNVNGPCTYVHLHMPGFIRVWLGPVWSCAGLFGLMWARVKPVWGSCALVVSHGLDMNPCILCGPICAQAGPVGPCDMLHNKRIPLGVPARLGDRSAQYPRHET